MSASDSDKLELTTSWKEEGREIGREEARQEIAAGLLPRLGRVCGPITPAMTVRVANLSIETLSRLGVALFDFHLAADLENWLAKVDDRRVTEYDVRSAWEFGHRDGVREGYREGFRWGRQEGSAQLLIRLLAQRFGSVPESMRREILSMRTESHGRVVDALPRLDSLEKVSSTIQYARYCPPESADERS